MTEAEVVGHIDNEVHERSQRPPTPEFHVPYPPEETSHAMRPQRTRESRMERGSDDICSTAKRANDLLAIFWSGSRDNIRSFHEVRTSVAWPRRVSLPY